MDGSSPSKQSKTVSDYSRCIICQGSIHRKKPVNLPLDKCLGKIIDCLHERHRYLDTTYLSSFNRLKSSTWETLKCHNATYHSDCYKALTNSSKIERLKQQSEKAAEVTLIEEKEKVQSDQKNDPTSSKVLRSSVTAHNKEVCIICCQRGGTIHKVEFNETGDRMLKVAKSLQDQGFFIRLNNIPNANDAVANDVQYHLKCWVNAQRSVAQTSTKKETIRDIENVQRVIADLDIIDVVKSNLLRENNLLDMNNLNKTYNNLLGKEQVEEQNCKRYLKKLLLEIVPDIEFSRPPSRRLSEKVCCKSVKEKTIHEFSSIPDNYRAIHHAAKIIRGEILATEKWKFYGRLSSFEIPDSLLCFLRWVLVGTQETVNTSLKKKNTLNMSVNNISQIIMKSTKSKRQVQNPSKSFKDTSETPLSVGLALHLHKETRSKKVIDCLFDLGITISYDKVLNIENDIANEVVHPMKENDNIYVPSDVINGNPLQFAINNIDFRNDTPDGKSEFHGTAHLILQKIESPREDKPFRFNRDNKVFQFNDGLIPSKAFNRLTESNEIFPNFEKPIISKTSYSANMDCAWALIQTSRKDSICPLPTWNAFNSLLSDTPEITGCYGLPLYPGSPTDWSNLYTSLKLVQGINLSITGSNKTMVTLDLQLYAKCMQMRAKQEIKDNYIFRLGELHTIFAYLKVLGKYITDSGLDTAILETKIYGPTTFSQILEGKRMKRALEAHMVLYLCLFHLFLAKATQSLPDVQQKIESLSEETTQVLDDGRLSTDFFRIIEAIKNTGVLSLCESLDKSLEQKGLYLRNYMKMFEVLLQFIRSSRDNDWELHLTSLNAMVKYFFAHDQINYALMVPLYLATMLQLQATEIESWNYLKENFSVSKSSIPFTSIGTDHALEQKNKVLKVTGGITGLTQNPVALQRFCLVAPILSSISQEFCQMNNIISFSRKEHYQLTGSIETRVSQNVKKLLDVFQNLEVSSNNTDCVFNVASKAILPKTTSEEILKHAKIGEELYDAFIEERIKGSTNIWSPIKKRNLQTFNCHSKKVNTIAQDKLVQLKEERTLLSRFLIAARKRPELNLEESIGNYEFSVVPKSMFTNDGKPLICTDKSNILHEIEALKIEPIQSSPPCSGRDTRKVIIVDGMALVNIIPKDVNMLAWKDFAESFVKALENIASGFQEVRLVFDRYLSKSLKSKTREYRTNKRNTVKYKVSDTGIIASIPLKNLLAHNDTKQQLTVYLSKYSMQKLQDTLDVSVTYDKCSEASFENFSNELKCHDHEEADTLLVLHEIDVGKNNPFCECYVWSPDTDVFLLLIYHYPLLPEATFFRTGKRSTQRDIYIRGCYEGIGSNRAAAILGFHTLSGCDQTALFIGRSKLTWWKAFMGADEPILDALAQLGSNESLPEVNLLNKIESFIVLAYSQGKPNTNISTLAMLRWFLFSKYQLDPSLLPPTESALKFKIFRCHYVRMVLKRASQVKQNLPPVQNYGWEEGQEEFNPILTDKLPAPLALIELSVCSCKGDCTNRRCKCFKNQLICTDMCKCQNCLND